MSDFWQSPVFAAIVTVVGGALLSLITMVAKLNTKQNELTTMVANIAQDVTDIKNDKNIMRWSDIRNSKSWRK